MSDALAGASAHEVPARPEAAALRPNTNGGNRWSA
jgi:hypothetical protein